MSRHMLSFVQMRRSVNWHNWSYKIAQHRAAMIKQIRILLDCDFECRIWSEDRNTMRKSGSYDMHIHVMEAGMKAAVNLQQSTYIDKAVVEMKAHEWSRHARISLSCLVDLLCNDGCKLWASRGIKVWCQLAHRSTSIPLQLSTTPPWGRILASSCEH